VTPETRVGLQALASALLAGSSVSIPREWLLDLLQGAPAAPDQQGIAQRADLTVAALAARFGRKTSTVRGWLERGLFPGAYRFQGREWRVPAAGLVAFEADQRKPSNPERRGIKESSVADLDDWRQAS
jgi:hypothetical protein